MLAYLTSDHAAVVDVVQISDNYIKLMVTDLIVVTDAMHKHIVTAIQQRREVSWEIAEAYVYMVRSLESDY